MSRTLFKKITRSFAAFVSVATILGFVPGLALFAQAVSPVTYSADTAVSLSNGDTLTIVSASTADSVTVNATANTVSVTVSGVETFTLKAANNKALANDGGYNQCTQVGGVPQITVSGTKTVVFTLSGVDCGGGGAYVSGGGGGGGGGSSAPATVVSITSPASGASVTAGASQKITWSTSGSGFDKVEIDYSTDGGTKYTQVATGVSVSLGTYAWIAPTATTNTAVLKVIGFNSSNSILSTSTLAFKVVTASATTTPTTTPTTTTTPATTTSPVVTTPSETPETQTTPAVTASPVAVLIHDPSKFDELLTALGTTSNPSDFAKYMPLVKSDALAFKVGITDAQQTAIANFVTYGASTETVKLGSGERRAEVRDYFETVGSANVRWDDIQRMTTGQKLVHRNLANEQAQVNRVLANFKLMVGHTPNFKNTSEDLAWNTMMYRIRFPRDLKAEQAGILKFEKIYKHVPKTPLEWSIVRALGYALK